MNQAPAASSAREASVASSARNVRPRTAESGRMEDVVPSRKRRPEEVSSPDDPNLTLADESQMGISEMAVILMLLGVVLANFEVAELFCRNRFGESAVDMGFERGVVVDYATGWSMSDEEQMEEVEQRIRDEEPVLLIGSRMCRAFSSLVELTHAGKPSEFELKSLVERCVTHVEFCFRMYETLRNAGRLFLHEHPWDAWSRGLSFVSEQYRERIMVHVELRLHHRGVEQALLQQRWPGRESHEELCGCCVEGLEEREIDSVKAIGPMEVGVICEEPNVLELDEYAGVLQNVLHSISGVRLDPELLSTSRKVEIDFMNRL